MAEPTLLPERLQYRPTKIELDESIEKAKATLLKKIKRSVYVYRVDCGGCNGCEIEIFGSITPVFDVERFGIKVVPSPRHADVLLYTGAVTRAMRMPALRAFEAAPDPKIVVSYGACGCTGGIFYDNYCVWGGTDKILPVDVYIPGCPPRPEAMLYGMMQLQRKVKLQKFFGDVNRQIDKKEYEKRLREDLTAERPELNVEPEEKKNV